MALSIAIVGLPNVGKSTLFNALTDANALAANYPFATIEPNTGIVPITDERLVKLAELYKTDKIVPATVTFVDIAGLVAGASHGEGLGNQFLSHIRNTNAICQVVRAFDESDVQRAGSSDPKHDIDIINTELVLADLQTVDNRLPRLEKEVKADPKLRPLLELTQKLKSGLEAGKLAGSFLTAEELDEIRDLQLLSAKPFLFVFNLSEKQLNDENLRGDLSSIVAPAPVVFVSAKLESELRGLDKADRAELMRSYGQTEPGLVQLIHAAYAALGLQSFLTAGEKEVRAWTIPKKATAPQAAGVIHTDFERGFIAAQVVDYGDLIAVGSEAAARAAGKIRTEGKNYIMRPGDVVEFKFNV
ncbi:redox-regulated ATPase YchF [Candidatus Saccharibacteria bacterium]|nr:redox-regulated ATPase YchF [Candidatus Saccharibacteria bacterium]